MPLGIDDTANAVNWTVAGVQGIGLENIDVFEIGNEPDIYPNNNDANVPLLPPAYQGQLNAQSYVLAFSSSCYVYLIECLVTLPNSLSLRVQSLMP